MMTSRGAALGLAGLWAFALYCRGAVLQEDFSSDPATRGWKAYGNARLFHWNGTNKNMEVTWDSSCPNSYYCLALGTILTKSDTFSIAFDLLLSDFAAGVNPQKPNPFQLSVGLFKLAEATKPGFARGTGLDSPDLVEFSFFPDPGGEWTWGPSLTVKMSDSNCTNYNHWSMGGFAGLALTSNDVWHVEMVYTAESQNLHTTITRNGEPFGPIEDASFGPAFEDFRVDHLSICSYSDAVQVEGFYGSILAHGIIDNFRLTLPDPPLKAFTGGLTWTAVVESATNWVYSLERSRDLQSWTRVSPFTPGTGGKLLLQDLHPPQAKAFYRVQADRP
jgi:hypothetical protein